MSESVSDELYEELLQYVRNELQKQFMYFPVFESAHPLSEDIVSFVTGRKRELTEPLSSASTRGHTTAILNALKARGDNLSHESLDRIRAIERFLAKIN